MTKIIIILYLNKLTLIFTGYRDYSYVAYVLWLTPYAVAQAKLKKGKIIYIYIFIIVS